MGGLRRRSAPAAPEPATDRGLADADAASEAEAGVARSAPAAGPVAGQLIDHSLELSTRASSVAIRLRESCSLSAAYAGTAGRAAASISVARTIRVAPAAPGETQAQRHEKSSPGSQEKPIARHSRVNRRRPDPRVRRTTSSLFGAWR